MELFVLEDVGKAYGGRTVFSGVTFSVPLGGRVAVVGPNGAGKTTLLRIILGLLEPDQGRVIVFRHGLRFGYLPQVLPEGGGRTVREDLELPPGPGLPAPPPGRVLEALSRFELPADGSPQTLSGGERTRLGLARMWLSDADCLVLDEPTNHLDQAGMDWLADYLRGFPGTVLVVSHDRYFLDQTVETVMALDQQGVKVYAGNFTAYRLARERAEASQMALYQEQRRRQLALSRAMERQTRWAKASHDEANSPAERARAAKVAQRGKALVSRLERALAEAAPPPRPEASISPRFAVPERGGPALVLAADLGKSFAVPLFQGAGFSLRRGDKVGLVGPNGSGKTTLLRMVARLEQPSSGQLWVSPKARIGYFEQELRSLVAGRTVLQEVMGHGLEAAPARNLLAAFMFAGETVFAPVEVLSQGERARLVLLKLLLSPFNLLLLDEPTNYLDVSARERVEEALERYPGSLVLVTHDRYFLRRVCSKVLAIEGGTIRTYLGGYDGYAAAAHRPPGGAAASGTSPADAPDALRTPPGPTRETPPRLVLENRLAVLSGRLARLARGDPEYEAAVAEFLEVARALRESRGGGQARAGPR